jgi:hypothetical protein
MHGPIGEIFQRVAPSAICMKPNPSTDELSGMGIHGLRRRPLTGDGRSREQHEEGN